MEDLKYLDTLADIERELQEIISIYNLRSLGLVGKATLVRLRLEQNMVLAEAVARHNRVLRYFAGEPVEPVAHSAEAILVGVMGGDAG